MDSDARACLPADARYVEGGNVVLQEDGWQLPHERQPTSLLQDREEYRRP